MKNLQSSLQNNMLKKRPLLKVVLLYAAFAVLWIITSDELLIFYVDDAVFFGHIEQAKGLFFVAVTSTLLYLLLKYCHRNTDVVSALQNNALQQSMESVQVLMNSALDAVISMNQQGKVIGWNPQAETIFGYSPEQAIGREVAELIVPPVHRNIHRQGIARFIETGTASIIGKHIETQGMRADGSEFPIELTILTLTQNNEQFFSAYIRDISERKKADEEIRSSKAKLEAALASMNDAVFISDIEGRFIEFNETFATFHKFKNKKECPKTLSEYPDFIDVYLSNGEFVPLEQRTVPRALRGEAGTGLEFFLRRKDTGETWIGSYSYAPIRNNDGEIIGSVVTARDITKRKKIEEALIASEKEFRLLAEAMPQIVWVTRPDGSSIYLNRQWVNYTGLTLEESYGHGWNVPFHPNDKQRAWEIWQNAVDSNEEYSLECQLRRHDGLYRWWLMRGVPILDENGKISKWFGTCTDIHDIKQAEETIYGLAYYDPLTGLPNRRLMLDRLKQTLISRTHKTQHGAILFINLDNFRNLNDAKGHSMGDLLLVAVSKHLQDAVHEDDTVARIGSDEFVMLLEGLDEATDLAAAQAESVANRVLTAINQPFDLQGYEYGGSASIGISLFRGHKLSVDELVKQADMAMHQAKQTGCNTICFFDPAIQMALESRVQLESWMRKALNDQYKLYYQIQVDKQGHATGAEALIRWLHPERGLISPADFIPLAEETGLILSIGQWVLETACAQLKVWEHHPLTRHLTLSVNVSAKQFTQPDFVEQVLKVLAQTQIAPGKLKLELTESMLVNNVEDIITKMNVLKAKGVKFSLDDFGTGFSSLTYLKRLPLNQLKIDQSFVRDALTDPNDAAITRTIIALGQSLDMEVIAEGVETEAHRNFLASHGCHHYQGYLFSKPLPLAEFEQLVRNL